MHNNNKYYLKLIKIITISAILYPVLPGTAQVYLTEGFEMGARPTGWTEEYVSGIEPWRYRNGGHSPNDNNWLVPPEQEDITRNPPSAYEGIYNAIFFKQGDNNERTKLITPAMNLLGGTKIELSFYLCQIPWTFEGSTGWDVLRVYYKVSESSSWVLLHEYLDPVYEWEQQTLVLPNLSSTYYIAFEGHTRWGYGTCIDKISVEEKGNQAYWIKELDFQQPFTDNVPSGSPNVPVMRIGVVVFGNTGDAVLDYINFTSLNTSDSDIKSNGVKLYSTLSQTFTTDNPLGSATNFVSGVASFTGLNHSLPRGQSYLWLAFDLNLDIAHGNFLDVKVAAGGIMANDTLYPAVEESPSGSRTIYKTQYFEDFEGSHGWSLAGEFEVNEPAGSGGSPGNPDPSTAFSGSKILGTDLTGLGSYPYNYEPNLSEVSSYKATSPAIDMLYYKNINLFFQRYLNIEVWDHSSIQVSNDNGSTWNDLWESSSYLSDFQWNQQQIAVPDAYSRTDQLKIRYQMGPTDALNNYSGWNIDDIYITGEFISRDVGVSEWIYPLSGSGHSATDSVIVRIRNYGGAEITDPVPVAYSFNGGATWIVDNMTQNIPVGGSVAFTFPTKVDLSVPGLKPSVLAKTMFSGDQYTGNDQISTQIYIVPTYAPPYLESFESNDGYWRKSGNNIWEYGIPAGAVINKASSGTKSWVTGLTKKYGDIISQKNKIIFEDDFESDQGWSFTGEFERNIPDNMNLPYFAYSGYYCIGTDLSGQGTIPFNYENGISTATAYKAVSPAFDVTYYSNLKVSYLAFVTIQAGDSVRFEVSKDNGVTWYTMWKNTEGEIMNEDFVAREFTVADSLVNTSTLRFRFSLFYSSAAGSVAQGWSVDDFILTGDLVNTSEGYLSSPSFDLTGITNPVFETHLWTDTEQDVDGATLLYSLDDGDSWTPITNSSGYDTYWNWYTGKPVSALGLNGWSGQSGGWMTARHFLPPALLEQNNVQFRFKFKADKFNNQYDGIGVDDVRIIEAPYDVGVLDILSPSTACELSSAQKFTLRLKNYGIKSMKTGDSIKVGYYIDRGGEIQTEEETIYLTSNFLSGATRDFSMSAELDYSQSGEYNTYVYTIEDEPFFYNETANDTLYKLIKVNKPYVELGPDISTDKPENVTINAFSGVTGYDYLWQDNSTDSVFHVSTYGTYYVKVTNSLGCEASDTITVKELVPDIGVNQLVSPASACELGSLVPVEIRIENFGTDTLEVGDTIFIYRDINYILLRDTLVLSERFKPGNIKNYTYSSGFDFSTPGIYTMKLYTRYIDDLTKTNDTLKTTLEVYGYPVIDLGPDTVVLAPQYILTADAGYDSYLWQDGSTINTYTVVQQGYGKYYVRVSNEHDCTITDTVRVTLNVTDLELSRILSPETSCGLSETVTISVRVINAGNVSVTTGQTLKLGYLVDGGSPEEESLLLSDNLSPGDSVDFVFAKAAQVVTGEYHDFTGYVAYSTDMKSMNDTTMVSAGIFESPVVDLGEDLQVVTGLEYILDAGSGYSSYLWHDLSTAQTYTVDVPGINNCSVTVTDNNGCTDTDEVQIFLSVPDIGITEIIHPSSSCSLGTNENIQVAIKNSGTGDIDKSANIAVSYSVDGGSAVTENIILSSNFVKGSVIYHTFSGSENFSIPGRYEIVAATVYGSDLVPSNDTLKVNVDIYGNPAIDIGQGKDTILVYDPLTLSAGSGFTSYKWQDGSINSSYAVTVPGTGMYSVQVTDNNGCSARDSVYVVYDSPDIEILKITAPVSSCSLGKNTPVSIEIINNGYYRILKDETVTVHYSVNSGSQVTETIKFISALNPDQSRVLSFTSGYDFSAEGNYQIDVSLDYILDEKLSNNTSSNTISVWGLPDIDIGAGKDTIRAVLPVTLDAGSAYSSYLWQDNSAGTKFSVVKWGLYKVIVTDLHGCSSSDSVYVYSPTGINDLQLFPGKVSIFPNPVYDILRVMVEMEAERYVIMEMYSFGNTLVYRKDFKQIQEIDNLIDVKWMAPGLYFLRITVDHILHTFPVIVL